MNDKKNIDRLFQEKFKDFEVVPDEAVWEKIKARQNNRKRLLILPFWYKAAGVAALLAIIFTVGYMSRTPDSQIETVVSNDKTNTKESIATDIDTIDVNPMNTSITSSDHEKGNESDSKTNSPILTEDVSSASKHQFNNSQNAVVSNSEKNVPELIESKDISTNETKITDNSIKKEQQPTSFSPKKEKDLILKDTANDKTAIAGQQESKPEKENPLFTTPKQEDNITNTEGIAANKADIDNITKKQDSIPGEVALENDPTKKSIFDVIAKEDEEAIAEETATKKWNVSPNVAPVYYSSIGNGSSIDSQFADNSKDGQVNLSYGVQVSYNVNKRLSVRSGVNKVDLSYNTQGIGFSPSSTIAQNLESVDYTTNTDAILVSDIGSGSDVVIDSGNSGGDSTGGTTISDINRNSVNRKQNVGLLNQRIGYIEVPLEMKYALVDKKLGVNMIGGLSTLFLQDNEISIEAGNFETPIGKGNNLNEISFSGNVGLGIDYKLSDQFQINVEPIFKYQINAFSGDTNNFRPYYFGVYTGVSIKF